MTSRRRKRGCGEAPGRKTGRLEGLWSITIPKMDFPKELTKDPKKSLVFEVNAVLNTHQASITDPLTNEVITDDYCWSIIYSGTYF